MITYTNECVDCPQGCVHCGRKRMRTVICDNCGAEIDADEVYTRDGNDDLCLDCLLELCEKEVDEEDDGE